MTEQPARVLVVESESSIGGGIADLLRETYHYEVSVSSDAENAWECVVQPGASYDVLLINDLLRPDGERQPENCGVELFIRIKNHSPRTQGIVLTDGAPQRTIFALGAGAFQCLARTFAPDQLALLTSYAIEHQREIESRADEDARRYKQLKRSHEELENLRLTTLAISSLLNRKTLLTRIIEQALWLLGARSGGIYEYHLERRELTIVAERGRPDYVGETLKVGEGMAGRLVESGDHFMIVDNYNEWSGRAPIYEADRPFGAVLEVPLTWERNIIGVLYVDDDVGRKFDETQATLLGRFAEQAAITLANAELLVKDAEKVRRLERLSLMSSEIVDDLSSMLLDQRLNLIAKRAAEILEGEACGICLVKREGFLSWEASYGEKTGVFSKGREFEIKSAQGFGLTGHIAKEGKLFNAWGANLTNHWAARRDEKDRVSAEHCYSLLALPLKKGDQLIGLLRVENKLDIDGHPRRGLHFTQEDEWMLNSFGQAVVVAVEEAKVVGELHEQKDYLERLVASSPNGIIAIDLQAHVTAFNRRSEQVLEYTKDEVLGKPVAELYSDPGEPREIGRLLHENNGILTNYETLIQSKAGERIPINISATWLFDANRNRIGSVGYFEDLRIAKQKDRHLELLLNASNIIAQARNMNEGLQRLAEMMVSLLTSTFCRILLLDETEQYLIPRAAYPIARPVGGDLSWTPGLEQPVAISDYPCLREHFEEGQPKILSYCDDASNPGMQKLSRRLGLERDLQSLLIVPLKIESRVVGLLDVGELRQHTRTSFSPEKIELASAIAAQTIALIDRLRLHDITERRESLLEALDETSRKIRAVRGRPKLMQEIVRLAVELVGCDAGGLFVNRPYLKQLDLTVTYGLPANLEGTQLPHSEGLIGLVARTGAAKIVHDYDNWPDREPMFAACGFKTVVAIPFQHMNEVDAVLYVADTVGNKQFVKTDLDILERFAAQASIALQTSLLMGHEQRMTSQLAILHKISDYIQAADDLKKILRVVLTGVTADYGLRFNRALLLLLDGLHGPLVGQMGIGQFDEEEARQAWRQDDEHKLDDFARYLELLDNDQLPETPVGRWVTQLRFSVDPGNGDAFSRAVTEKRWMRVKPEERGQLPAGFTRDFDPTSTLAIVPLTLRDQVLGLLVVDNKFTRSPITDEDLNSLATFANTAAIAIHNARLLKQIRVGSEKLFSYYEVSRELSTIQDPVSLRKAIVEQTHKAAEAAWVSLLLIDDMGRAQNPITVGEHTHPDDEQLIRPNGISMQVIRSGEAVIMEDLTKQPAGYVNPVMLQGNTKAALCLPLSLPDKRIGVMWIHYDKPGHIPELELAALQLYVNQAASAYESALRMEKLEKMRKAADALAEASDLARVLEQIAHSARDVLRADSAVLWFYDAEADNFILEGSVAAGIEDEVWSELRKVGPQKHGTAYRVMNSEWVPVGNIGDTQQSQVLGETTRKLLDDIGAEGFQGIVLSVGDEKLGVVYANYNRPCVFGEEERESALTFANHAALALKKAKLFDQLKRAKKAAAAVAKVTALGDRKATLTSIARETMSAVGCDAVVLFEYDRIAQKVMHPPTMEGVRYPEKALSSEEIVEYELVRKVLKLDQPYVVERIDENNDFKDKRFARDEQTMSCVALPLQAGKDKMGVMFVNYRSHRRFTKDELENIELFGDQAAVAIRNAQLFEERSKKLGEQTALVKLSNELLATETLQETMNAAVRVAAEVLDTEYCDIVLLDPLGRLRFVAAVGWPQSMIGSFELESGRGSQTGYTIETRVAVRVDDYEDRKARQFDVPSIVFEHEIKSGMSVPMFRGGQVIGAMLVHTKTPRQFYEEEESVLSLIANTTAIAIQSAERYEASLKKSAYLHALYEASKAITASFGLERERVLDQIVQQAVEGITGIEGRKAFLGTLQLYDEKTKELVTESIYPIEEYQGSLGIGARRPIGESKPGHEKIGVSGRTVWTRKPQLVPDVRLDEDYVGINLDTKAELTVPLMDLDQVLGVLNVESKQAAGFDEEDLNTLQALADLAVIVIKNAMQYQELKETKGLVGARTALAWMGMASSAWWHGVRTDVLTISNTVELLRNDLKAGDQRELRGVEERMTKIESLVRKIRNRNITPPLSSADSDVTSVFVEDLIEERINQLWDNDPTKLKRIKRKLKLPKSKRNTVRASSEWLRRALDMIVDNAVEAMLSPEPVPNPQLTIATRLVNGTVEITIADNGRGIPEELRPKLFLEPIPKDGEKNKGLGIGLLMVQAIIQTYGGEIHVDSTGPNGTKFLINLPVEG